MRAIRPLIEKGKHDCCYRYLNRISDLNVWSAGRISQVRFLSSEATRSSTNITSSSKSKDSTLLFPWRHSQKLLPRIELESYRINKDWRSRFFIGLWERSTGLIMEKSVPELVGRQWRQDLAEESAWAFSCGVAALLSNTFKVPMDDILLRHGETGEIVFAYTTPFTRESISQTEEQAATGKDGQSKQAADSLNAEETSEEESTDQKSSTINQTQSSYYFDDVEEVFEEDVIELYRSFHKKFHEATRLSSNEQTPAPLEITLTLTPVDAELHKIFCFPFLSRSAVKEDKSRKKDYMTMLESIRHEGAQSFFKAFWAFADRMLAERGMMQTTVMADVMIECTESFQVKDVSTNEILQGDGIERTVRHCVRMERDSSLVQEDNQEFWVQGNWKIADIDDHLVGRGLWTPI